MTGDGVDEFRARLLGCRRLSLTACWPLLRQQLPELAALANVHMGRAEGRPCETALEHTQRLLDWAQPRLKDLSPDCARSLYLAALLHEVGRVPAGDSRSATSRYAPAGAAPARDVLFRLHVPPLLRDGVVQLVRSHSAPLTLGRRPARPPRLLRLAWTLDTRLLYLLALGDCETGERPQACAPAVAGFRGRCEDLGILGREPPPLLTPQHWRQLALADPRLARRMAGELRLWRVKGIVNTPQEAEAWLARQQPVPGSTFFLLVGVPGSGKSTWAADHLQQVRLISMDDMRERLLGDRRDQSRNPEVYRRSRAMLAQALRAGETVAWDAQSHTWSARQGLLTLARETRAYVIIVFLDVPLAVALERNRRRSTLVPEDVIRRSYRQLEEPRPFEAEEIWRIGVDGRCTRYASSERAGA